MKSNSKLPTLVGALAFALAALGVGPARAQMGSGHEMMGHGQGGMSKEHHAGKSATAKDAMPGPHGGAVESTGEFQFETVFTETGVRVYVMDAAGAPIPARGVEGTATFTPEKGKARRVPLAWTKGLDDPMAANRIRPGAEVNDSLGFLSAADDLREATDGSLDVTIALRNLPGTKQKTAQWSTPYQRTPLFGMACPMHPDQAALEEGKCSQCGGMDYQPAYVFYECCPSCGEMRRTSPGTCEKCGMEMNLKSVGKQEPMELKPAKPRRSSNTR